MGFWLLLLLIVLLIATLPTYPHSRGWGYGPAAVVAFLFLIWFVAVWIGWLAFAWPWTAAPAVTTPVT